MPPFIIGHILWLVPNYQGMALIKIGGAQNETTKIGFVFPVTTICFYKFTNFARYSNFMKAFAWLNSINKCRQTGTKLTLSTYFFTRVRHTISNLCSKSTMTFTNIYSLVNVYLDIYLIGLDTPWQRIQIRLL